LLSVLVTEVYDEYILVIDTNDINHIKNVFRKEKGDIVRAVDGSNEYLCEIEEINDKEIKLKIIEKKADKFSLDIELDAGISILKGDKMDLTIQKLTELGINKIIPIAVKRCVVKLDKKKDRWDTIAKEALKQCQGVVPTVVDEIKKIDKLNLKDYDLVLVPYENEEEIFLKDILRNLKVKPSKILYVIGAEGGFEKEEIDFLESQGAKIISLGKRILRAETAAIVTGGVIINEFF
jgi:RNA methyltransferase, rsmE family